MGNLVVANLKKRVEGARRKVGFDVTYSNSYATNGDSFIAADLVSIAKALGAAKETDLTGVELFLSEIGSDGTLPMLDKANGKLKAFKGAEVANATNLSAITVHCEAFGQPAT